MKSAKTTFARRCPVLVSSYDGFARDQAIRTSFDGALRSLYRIWADAVRVTQPKLPLKHGQTSGETELRLHDHHARWVTEHLGAQPHVNPFGSLTEARKALHSHPIHQWLTANLADTMSRARQLDALAAHQSAEPQHLREFSFVLDLLSNLILCAEKPAASSVRRGKSTRPDRERATLSSKAHAIRVSLDGDITGMPRTEREQLDYLLNRFQKCLAAPRPKMSASPALEATARMLWLHELGDKPESGRCSVKRLCSLDTLREIANFAGLNLEDVTLNRYLEGSQGIWYSDSRTDKQRLDDQAQWRRDNPGKPLSPLQPRERRGPQADWHILDDLKRDYRANGARAIR